MNAIFDLAPPFARRAYKKNEKLIELFMNEYLRFALAKQKEMLDFSFYYKLSVLFGERINQSAQINFLWASWLVGELNKNSSDHEIPI